VRSHAANNLPHYKNHSVQALAKGCDLMILLSSNQDQKSAAFTSAGFKDKSG